MYRGTVRVCEICEKPLNAESRIKMHDAFLNLYSLWYIKDVCIDCKIEQIKKKNKARYKKQWQDEAEKKENE